MFFFLAGNYLFKVVNKNAISLCKIRQILAIKKDIKATTRSSFQKQSPVGKHLCQSLFFYKVAYLRPAILFKKRIWHRHFPVNFAKFLRPLFFVEHLLWLLLTFPQAFYKIAVLKIFENLQKTSVSESLLTFAFFEK